MKKIIFLLLPALCLFAAFRSTQNIIITGTVVSDKGNPVEGASVTAIGTRSGTATDINGYYRLNISEQSQAIRFSGAGFETKEKPINNQRVINVVLIRDSSKQSENIVVTALGIRRQSSAGVYGTRISNEQLTAGSPVNRQTSCNKGSGLIIPAKKTDTIKTYRKQKIKQSNP